MRLLLYFARENTVCSFEKYITILKRLSVIYYYYYYVSDDNNNGTLHRFILYGG